MMTATSPRATLRVTPRSTSSVPCRFTRSRASIMRRPPPFAPQRPSRRSDHRENHDNGTLIAMYRTAVAIANSITPPVLFARIEYCFVSSTSVITEQTDVSLKSAMKSFVTGGITIRTACGTITRRKAILRDIPSASAASICPTGIACKPAR